MTGLNYEGPSVLFTDDASCVRADVEAEPDCFRDLNLDQVIAAITEGRDEYELQPFFWKVLDDPGAVAYRHEVFRDLERPEIVQVVRSFAERLREVRKMLELVGKLRHRLQKARWFLDAVAHYGRAIDTLTSELAGLELGSRGLRAFRDFLARYDASVEFRNLVAETRRVEDALAEVRYLVNIHERRVTVRRYEEEPDYSAEVLATFARFEQSGAKDYRVGFPNHPEMNHVEEAIVDLVARLFEEEFAALGALYSGRQDFFDDTVRRFDREVQFYLANLEHVDRLRKDLPFCYPEVSKSSKHLFAWDSFDLALATKLVGTAEQVVCNDFELAGVERILVVSGPNQGGKTTFARMFGQLHHLAAIGCPVPGNSAHLLLARRVFTHFEQEEDLDDLVGKLEDDLLRVRDILQLAGPDDVVVVNEIFTSTSLADAVFLGSQLVRHLTDLGVLATYVTFIDELASATEATVSMTSTIVPEDPARRTYKVVRRPADGLAYAAAIAEKYGLTHERLTARLAR